MSQASIAAGEWLRFMEQEYLADYVRAGGAAIKFAVPLDETPRAGLLNGLAGIGDRAGYLVVQLDAAETRIHMMDEIFFRTAARVPWQRLSRRIMAKLAAEAGYAWVEDGDGPLYQRLADENQVDAQMLLLDLKKAIGHKLFKQRNLSRDFRMAMTQLCIAELSGGQDGATAVRVLIEWLTGRNKAVSAVKPYQIFRKISRTTARYFFEAMLQWVRLAGYPGLMLLIDLQRLTAVRTPHAEGLFYSKAALFDTYEVFRQFIDSADRLEGFFMAVVPDIAFLEDLGRGINIYEALKYRVYDEIRDRNMVNPMASLARIAAGAQGALG